MDDYGSDIIPKQKVNKFTMQNIKRLIIIDIMFLKMTL